MKLKSFSKITKKFSILLLVVCAFIVSPKDIFAGIHPNMTGYVRNSVTNAPVPNVWVKWRSGGCGSTCHCPGMSGGEDAYALTDANGYFFFGAIFAEGPWDLGGLGQMIDTNFDGVVDDERIPRYTGPYCIRSSAVSPVVTWNFGCTENTHVFTGVRPSGWSGTFSSISYEMNNISGNVDLGTIWYNPAGVPTNTPTPTSTPTPPPPPLSCSITGAPSSVSVTAGSLTQIITNWNAPAGGTVDQVTFTPSNSSIAVCPFGTGPCASAGAYTDTTSSFSVDVTGLATGTSTIQIQGRMVDEGVSCPIVTTNVTVNNAASWWQVTNGDAITNGSLQSIIPSSTTCNGTCSPVFSLSTSGNSEGIPAAPGSASFGSGAVSSSLRLAKADYRGEVPPYSFSYFKNLYSRITTVNTITGPNPTTNLSGGTPTGDYIYFRYVGTGGSDTLTILNAGGVDFGTNKVVLLVENAEVRINSPIRLTKGRGFFTLIAEKNILVDPSVGGDSTNPGLSGIFATDNEFRTGTLGAGLDTPLYVRGSVKAGTTSTSGTISGGVVLQRNLANNASSAGEMFEFGADLLLSFPSALGESKVEWREVAP